ncbi:hypothetical protein ACAY42_000216 [Citrobacter freundii]|uniref:Uncharacterized protein n=2 Tax=Citrobacter freundii complex TaxID=1344959 RepID=A0AAN4F1Q7_CITFR|nr:MULTISPECIES: hypothetical protein [Citrobacter]ELQ7877270.1 hypothetical protein [Enterobacter asburiae]MBW7622139.1 hypothetical protein [Citrobacter portucalensis]EKW2111726.1 hypothetical protein [Citrobacter freundii]EKY1514898.1 hypothetical protein [Citrobacter freundii]ELA3554137.1 hypothetical protein [Citrobacter freundii]
MGKMTFVFEYEDGKEPPVGAGMSFMGGKIVAAAFRDALEEPEVCDVLEPDPDYLERIRNSL